MTEVVKKWELVPNGQEVIHGAMLFCHLLCMALSNHEDSLHAVASNLSLLGCYVGSCKSKWYQELTCSYACIMDPLWANQSDSVALIAKAFVFEYANGIWVSITISTSVSAVHHAKIRSQHKNEIITKSSLTVLL
jgi:hypothetical protein